MRIRDLQLQTAALQPLSRFYAEVLELEVTNDEHRFWFQAGHTRVQFAQTPAATAPFYHFAFNIPCNKIEEAKNWLSQKLELMFIKEYGGVIADFQNWQAQSLYFWDTAGNIVECIARRDRDNATATPFHPRHIESVSEIGLVCEAEKLEQATRRLQQQFGLPFFRKQPPLPGFRALGDDEGLLILVNHNRPWYPTQKRAGLFSLHLTLEQDGTLYRWHSEDADPQ